MSDVDAPVQNGVNGTNEDDFVDANEGDEEEHSAKLIQKEVKVEITDEDGNVAQNGTDDDRTEDQVPDITGTDNVGDPMTTSMDGIEDIPVNEETQEENAEEGAEIPVEQFEDAPEEPKTNEETPAEEAGEEVNAEEVPATEETQEEPAAEEETPAEEPPAEEEPVEETPAEEDEGEEIPVEQVPVEEEATEETPAEEEVPVEDTPQEETTTEEPEAEETPAEEEQPFELQAPPTPKRPRTPNELDKEQTPALSGQGSTVASDKESVPATPRTPKTPSAAGDAPGTPKSSARGSQPGTPKSTSNVGSVPPTPRSGQASNVSETPQINEPESPKVSTPKSSIAGTPKLTNGSIVGSPKSSAVGSPAATPRTGGTGTPRSKKEFDFDNVDAPTTPRTPKRTTFQEDNLSVTRSPRSPRTPRTPKSKTPLVAGSTEAPEQPAAEEESAEPESTDEPAAEPEVAESTEEPPPADETGEEEPKEEDEQEEPQVEEPKQAEESTTQEDAPSTPRPRQRAQSPSPPPRRAAREAPPGDHTSYNQDSHREAIPTRVPATTSFSSWNPPERSTYQPISPWVNTAHKYQSEHTTGATYYPPSTYTSIFDDTVNTGPFSHSTYATNRLLERSRSRTRERRQAFRSQRSASQYLRYTSQFPAPMRTHEYSTPRSSSVSRVPGGYNSFTSFLDYSGAKQYELSRPGSRGSLYDSTQALSRSTSRGNVDLYLGGGRLSRVDSYVNNLNSRYEWNMPATYELYRASSRGQISYPPLSNGYSTYSNYNSYTDLTNPSRFRRSVRDTTPVQWKSLYETRIGDLQRSLSRERFERDRLKNKYSQVSYQLEQACKQMDLIRTNSYSSLRSGSQPRTSVYAHFYPYY